MLTGNFNISFHKMQNWLKKDFLMEPVNLTRLKKVLSVCDGFNVLDTLIYEFSTINHYNEEARIVPKYLLTILLDLT